jgi:hypothetical protein
LHFLLLNKCKDLRGDLLFRRGQILEAACQNHHVRLEAAADSQILQHNANVNNLSGWKQKLSMSYTRNPSVSRKERG